jgi:hypothetical protein
MDIESLLSFLICWSFSLSRRSSSTSFSRFSLLLTSSSSELAGDQVHAEMRNRKASERASERAGEREVPPVLK